MRNRVLQATLSVFTAECRGKLEHNPHRYQRALCIWYKHSTSVHLVVWGISKALFHPMADHRPLEKRERPLLRAPTTVLVFSRSLPSSVGTVMQYFVQSSLIWNVRRAASWNDEETQWLSSNARLRTYQNLGITRMFRNTDGTRSAFAIVGITIIYLNVFWARRERRVRVYPSTSSAKYLVLLLHPAVLYCWIFLVAAFQWWSMHFPVGWWARRTVLL